MTCKQLVNLSSLVLIFAWLQGDVVVVVAFAPPPLSTAVDDVASVAAVSPTIVLFAETNKNSQTKTKRYLVGDITRGLINSAAEKKQAGKNEEEIISTDQLKHELDLASAASSGDTTTAGKVSQIKRPNNGSFGELLHTDLLGNTSNNNHGWQYWCDLCCVGFNKRKSYMEHLQGKRHAAIVAESESLWEDYQCSGSTFYDLEVPKDDVIRAWSLDRFMDGLQARSRSSVKSVLVTTSTNSNGMDRNSRQIDPSLRICDLSPSKRAALWRYLHTSGIGERGTLSEMFSVLPPHYARVKELLESVEVFFQIQRLMKRSTTSGQKATMISHIYDVGCGHGLVGMLCAVAFPNIKVHAIDWVPRDSFQAQRLAFQDRGGSSNILDNLTFEAGDLTTLYAREEDADEEGAENNGRKKNSLLLCVHGCKSLTHESIELAERNMWAWLSLPCCLQSENHLDEKTSLHLDDTTRFAMLCGAITAKYKPDTVTTIDSRITARGIVLASSGAREN